LFDYLPYYYIIETELRQILIDNGEFIMNKCLIILSHIEGVDKMKNWSWHQDCTICADGGLLMAEKLGLEPDLLIGDYDSMDLPEGRDLIKLPEEKDVTDSEAAIDLAISRGFDDITLVGGLGGRLDHTMGNLGMLAKYCGRVGRLAIVDSRNYAFMTGPGRLTIPKNDYKYLGIIAYGGPAENVTLSGVKYPLEHHLLTDHTTLGVSNEITASEAIIDFTSGKLLVILSSDVDKACML
jgi:thiamine pyrophosphokinase